jgi:polyphosphate kinase
VRRYVHWARATTTGHGEVYEDFGLFTADEDIAADVADLFNYLTGFGRPARFRKLLVAPFTLRQRLIEEIRDVADAARNGRKARIRIKVNGLTHTEVIDELYAASEAGARIDLLVRGTCSLRPGVSGLSDNIRVRSSGASWAQSVSTSSPATGFLSGSADLMPRNLDHRVEVVAPVDDIGAPNELAATIDALLSDTAS